MLTENINLHPILQTDSNDLIPILLPYIQNLNEFLKIDKLNPYYQLTDLKLFY